MATLPPLAEHLELGAELGRGAFGVVHRGTLRDGSPVAVKLHGKLPAGEEARILREAELLRGLRHPRLVTFHGLFEGPGEQLALVYELVEGKELEEHLAAGPLPLVEVLAMASGVAEGLDALHQLGLVHRDLKPGNIMLDAHGDPRLIDYGMLRSTEAGRTVTATGAVVGTPAYMAPEQITGEGRPTPALDQYALGCVVYECLTGQPPFSGDISAVIDGHLKRPPPRLRELAPQLPASLQQVLERMLAKRPEERYGSCGEAIRALDTARLHMSAAADATQVLDEDREAATRPLSGARDVPTGPVGATASLASVSHAPSPPEGGGALLPRVAVALLVTAGLFAGFFGGSSPEPAAHPSVATATAAPTASVDFPDPPKVPRLAPTYHFSNATRPAWTEWVSTAPKNPLYDTAIDSGHDVYVETLPFPVEGDLLALATSRGGVALLERGTLRHRASWRLEPLERNQNGHMVPVWYTPFLAPGPGGSAWLTASAGDVVPATLRLATPLQIAGHAAAPLRSAQVMPPWIQEEVFSRISSESDRRIVHVESTADSYDGEAWVGSADTPDHSSWISLRGEAPRPLSVLQAPVRGLPGMDEHWNLLHVSGREVAMRPFRAGGGWVRGAAALIKPSGNLPRGREAEIEAWVADLPGAAGTVRGHAGYAFFQAESPGTASGLGPVHWKLLLARYPEAYPYPFAGGFLMVHAGRLVHFPRDALIGEVEPEAGEELDRFQAACPEERFLYPTGTMTYDPRTGLDLLLWENLRFCRGREQSQRISWYRYPAFTADADGSAMPGPREVVARWEMNLEDMGVDQALELLVKKDLTPMDFPDLVKNPGFRRAQRLPGGRLWVVGLTSIDTVNRMLVLDLASARVAATLEAGNIKALEAGPVAYPGNEPGRWEVYFSDRGGRLFCGALPGTRPEDG